MSQSAMVQAVCNQLRTTLTLTAESCDVMFDGQPAPMAGEQFVAVHPGEWGAGNHGDIDLEEMIGVQVTLTRRLGYSPQDRFGPEVWRKATTGMEAILRKIVCAIHKSYTVMNAANTLITGTVNKFVEPLLFLDGGRPQQQGPDWFEASQDSGKWAKAGVSQTITFGRARRLQPVDVMT